eukprot:3067730-Rhodomonas_salina.1
MVLCDVLYWDSVLCYVLCGTHIAYGAMRPVVLGWRTGIAYGATQRAGTGITYGADLQRQSRWGCAVSRRELVAPYASSVPHTA